MKRYLLLCALCCVSSTGLSGHCSLWGNFPGPKWTAEVEFYNTLGRPLKIIDHCGCLIANSGNIGALTVYPKRRLHHGHDERFYIAYLEHEPLCALRANFSANDRVSVRVEDIDDASLDLRRVLAIARNKGQRDGETAEFVDTTLEELEKNPGPVVAQASIRTHRCEKKATTIIRTPLGSSVKVKCVAHKDSGSPYQSRCQFYFDFVET